SVWQWEADARRPLSYDDYEAGVVYEENTDFPETDAKWQATFTYKGEAETVALTGAFQYWTEEDAAAYVAGNTEGLTVKTPFEYKEGMMQTGYNPLGDMVSIELTEVAHNVWQAVVPLASGEYYYDYVVDGTTMQDPANRSVANPANGHDSGHSLIWIGEYGETDTLIGQEYVLPRTDMKGTYEFVPYIAASGNTSYVTVYLPYGYDPAKTYKTLYISHGGGGNEVEWHFIGAVDNIFDNLIAEGLVDETIVVSPTFSGVGDYTTNLLNNIIPLIESKYSVSTDARDRAMCGLSAGSSRSQQVYQKAAGEFGYFGFWSAASNYDVAAVANNDYPTILMGPGYFDFAYKGYAGLKSRFDAAGVPYIYKEFRGAHDWGVWREALTMFAKDILWKDEKLPNPETVPLGDIPFELEAHVYDYGEAINKVTIDLNDQGIDTGYLNKGSFKVVANGTYVNNRGVVTTAYEGVERQVEAVSIEDGIATIDLVTAFGNAGEGTLQYAGGRNLSIAVAYEVTFVGDVTLEDGTTADPRQFTFVQQGNFSDPEVDAFEYGETDGLPYRFWIPENYDDGEAHPLLLWLHGAGESGNANEAQIRANRGALGWVTDEAQEIFGGAFVLAPETASGWNNADVAKVIETIEKISAEYNVDQDRIHVAGCSMGGGGTVRIATTYPDVWATVVPICAAANANTYPDQLLLDTMGFQNVFFIHAENDTTVRPAGSSIRMHDVLPNSEFNLYPNVQVDGIDYPGHWSWIYFGRNEATAADGRSVWQWEADARRPLSYDDYEAGIEIAENTDFPESEANYQVTFTYKGEAEEVKITGAFQYWTRRDAEDYVNGNRDRLRVKTPYEYKEGMIQTGYNPIGDMVALEAEEVANDVWQVVVPLHAGEYYYDYVVDGTTMQDPANRSVANPNNGNDSGHSLLWVGEYGDTNTLADQEYVLPRTDEKKGTYEFVPYTTNNGQDHYVTVYLPYGYDESKTYKTLYISHGAGGNEVEWHFIGATDNIFDNLIAEGLVDETIVVSTNFNGVRDYAGNLVDVVIPLIESRYSVSTDARDRAMCGLSAGSSRSQQVYQRYAGLFGYFGFWSAASNFNVAAVKNNTYPTIMFGAGPFDFAYAGYAGLRQRFDAAGVPYSYHEFDGAHDWGVWRQALTLFARDYLWEDTDKPANPADGYEAGVEVTENPDTESNSGNIATFTFKTDEDYEKVTVFGGFQFFTAEEGDKYLAGEREGLSAKDAFAAAEAEEVMYPYGYSPVDTPAQFEYELTEITDGVWQTSLPLPSDQYFYAYNVYKDGVATKVEDPANPYTLNPVNGNNSGWCVFYAGTPETALENMDLTFPRTDDKVGTYEYVPYTNIRGQETSVVVYLPYGYDASKTYPTLYISHGGGGNEMDWPTVGAVKNIFDNAIAGGYVEPTIVVSMNNTELGWNYPQILANLTDILFPMMEEKYNASPNAADRAFSGLSMGGLTTTYLYRNAADKFGYFGIWSATQVFDVSEVPFNDYPTVMLGAGDMDFGNGAYPGLIAKAAEAGFDWSDDMYYVHDGHNWYAWPQLLEIFAKDYLWSDEDKPATAADAVEAGVEVTENPDTESNSGNIATFTFKTDEDYEKVTVFGGFQFFTAEEGDKYLAGEREGLSAKDAFAAAEAEEVMYPYGYSPVDTPAQFEYELTEITDGVWQTSLPLPSDQYFYAYNVYKDGVATKVEDPANPYTLNPVNGNNSGWCVFYAGTPETALENMDLTFPRTDDKVGTYEYVPYTNIRGQETSVVVYLPYGYDASKTYPTLYISHGGGGNEMDWPTVGAVKNIFDNAIAGGYVEPTIVVSMNNTELGWNYPQILANLTDILFPMMEEKYNASPNAADRAFSGLSMGGLTTTYLYRNAADKFGYFGIWSATQVFDVSKVDFNDYPTVMLGAGDMDFGNGAYPGLIEKAAEAGLDWSDDMYYVHDGHNWYAWPQLLEIFAKDYLWSDHDKPAEAPIPDTSGYKAGVEYAENTDFPESDAKWQATFTYKGEADSVALTGAFQYWTREDMENYKNGNTEGLTVKTPYEYKEGMVQTGYNPLGDMVTIQLEKVDYNVWQAVVPLASGEYYYDYVVDGVTMQDPANPSVANPANGHDSGHSLIWIGEYGADDVLEGQEYVLPRADQKGTFEFVPYIAANGSTSYVTVYKPYGYDESKTYKTLYISHGAGGNEVEWHFIGATDNIFDNLIAEGLVDETIVVSTNAYGVGNYVTNLWDKVVPLIEKLYPVSKEPGDRAMAGLSMGSMYAQNVYREHAGDFGYFGFWSAASNYDVNAIENKDFPTIMMGAGPFDFAYNGYAGLKERFDAAGVGYKWYEFNGAHDWGVWRAAVTAFAKDILWKEDKSKFEFDDVKDPERYFYDPVYWAYNHKPVQITTGTSPNLFSPDDNVTRGQMVTFLWRLAGQPEASAPSTFEDVDQTRYYADAIAWAAENDITTGYAGTNKFGPDDNCTREQIVTFLWRYAGEPKPGTVADFTDTKAGAYYLDAVSWAAENEITVGLNDGTGRFGVGQSCTRAMTVTFLYRFADE
ncbi:MAG: alpha/beta hydrolase-fold protein, partial [Erysipelotrichaceae bacterium]|nr:alpha/beta hydrolase-fold protein [Erysipelotrichaceae bacterium]